MNGFSYFSIKVNADSINESIILIIDVVIVVFLPSVL